MVVIPPAGPGASSGLGTNSGCSRYRRRGRLRTSAAGRRADPASGTVHRGGNPVRQRLPWPGGNRGPAAQPRSGNRRFADPPAPRYHRCQPLSADFRPATPTADLFRTGTPDLSVIGADPHWRAGLALWRQSNLSAAARQFELAAVAKGAGSWDISAAAYWAARAHLKNREPAKVSHWLGQAAQYPRSFYGQLA